MVTPKNMNMRQLWHTNKDNLSLESNGETIDTEQLCVPIIMVKRLNVGKSNFRLKIAR